MPRAYMDPLLRSDREEYRHFVLDGARRGLFDVRLQVCEQDVIVCVKKKDGGQRLVADCRKPNAWFSKPPCNRIFSSG